MAELAAPTTAPAAEPVTSEKVEIPAAAPSTTSPSSSQLPSQDDLNAVYDLDVLDKDNKAVKFRSLVQQTPQRRNIVVFIRHFFCGYCQEYIRALARDLPPSKLAELPTPTALTVIGCGEPKLISSYAKETSCPYEIFADPTRKTYDALGFVTSLGRNKKKPEYIGTSFLTSTFAGIKQGLKAGLGAKSGKISQNGGEMVWVDGELTFYHKMTNTTDHLEVKDLEKVLA